MGIKGKVDKMVVLACETCKERNYTTVKNKKKLKERTTGYMGFDMGKIDDFVKQHSLKPRDCLYHTSRSVKGTKNGSIRVLVPKTDSLARCEYVCPECSHASYVEQPWKRLFYTVIS